MEEKAIVVLSPYHRIEADLDDRLTERLRRNHGYLGQIKLKPSGYIINRQLYRAYRQFCGEKIGLSYKEAFAENPDKKNEPFVVDVKTMKYGSVERKRRSEVASRFEEIKKKFKKFEEVKRAMEKGFLSEFYQSRWKSIENGLSDEKSKFDNQLKQFALSGQIERISHIDISSSLLAYLFCSSSTRKIRSGDETDMEVISSYLPYVDIFATERFFSQAIINLGFDVKYNTRVFNSTKEGLEVFNDFLKKELVSLKAANKPFLTVFVLPDEKIRENSWEFFRLLGNQVNREREAWTVVMAFDDGGNPRYKLKEEIGSKETLPFTGFQNVRLVKIPKSCEYKSLIKKAKGLAMSDKFVIIDRFIRLEDNFIVGLHSAIRGNERKFRDFEIHSR